MEDLMKKGEFKAAKILPLVSKYLEEAANQGDALKKRLQQLEVVENRMVTSWTKLQGKIYETGGESGLKGLYRTLDQIFQMMSDENLVGGGFLKGFLDSATQSLKDIWDLGQRLKLFLKYDLGLDNVNGEMFGKAAYWISIAASIQVIAKAFSIIFGGGLLGNLVAFLSGGLGKAVTDSTEAASKTGVIAKAGGLLGKALGVGMAAELGLALGDWMRNTFPMVKDFGDSLGTYLAKLTTGFGNEQNQQVLSGAVGSMQGAGFNAAWANSIPLFMQNQQPQKVEITVDKAQGLENYVELKINERDQRKIAEILPTSFGTPPKF